MEEGQENYQRTRFITFFLILVDNFLLPLYFGDVSWPGGIHYLSLDALGTFLFLIRVSFMSCFVLLSK